MLLEPFAVLLMSIWLWPAAVDATVEVLGTRSGSYRPGRSTEVILDLAGIIHLPGLRLLDMAALPRLFVRSSASAMASSSSSCMIRIDQLGSVALRAASRGNGVAF